MCPELSQEPSRQYGEDVGSQSVVVACPRASGEVEDSCNPSEPALWYMNVHGPSCPNLLTPQPPLPGAAPPALGPLPGQGISVRGENPPLMRESEGRLVRSMYGGRHLHVRRGAEQPSTGARSTAPGSEVSRAGLKWGGVFLDLGFGRIQPKGSFFNKVRLLTADT